MNQSQENRIKIEANRVNITNIKEDIAEIKEQVTNHIPTQLKALDKRMDEMSVKLTSVVTIVTILIQLAFQYFS